MASGKKLKMEVEAEAGGIPKDHFSFKDQEYGERHFVREGMGYKEVTKPSITPVRVHTDRRYTMRDAESFVAYIERYGDPKKGIIFANHIVDHSSAPSLTMFFDESSRAESVLLPFKRSLEVEAFLGQMGESRTFGQKDLVKVLETFPDVVHESKLILPNIERLKIETAVNFESNTDERDYTFLYKEKEGSQTSRIPKQLVLNLPYFEGSKIVTTVIVDLEIKRPQNAEEKPTFALTDPKRQRTFRDAFEAEVAEVRETLPKWQFVWGRS